MEVFTMDISAIGGGMQGFGAMQGIQGMQQDFQAVQGPQDMKEMKGLENGQKPPKPEEMQAQGINQQDKTEMSDEAQEVNGAQAAAEAGKAQGQQQNISEQVKDTVQKIIDEAKVQGPGQQGQHQGTNQKVEMLKQQLNKAAQNGTPIDSNVKEAADRVVQGDIKGADQILNGQQQQKDQVGAAQGLAEEQQVGKAKETHADKIIAGIQGMGQVPQQ